MVLHHAEKRSLSSVDPKLSKHLNHDPRMTARATKSQAPYILVHNYENTRMLSTFLMKDFESSQNSRDISGIVKERWPP